jgi:DNA-binding transcriptional LysR family regulator
MPRDHVNEIAAFLAVARERSFTKAAGQLGVTSSALSHTIKGLETRLGVPLLSRTTRNVSTTEAGERLQRRVGPLMEQIGAELDDIGALRDRPAGNIRITCTDAVIEIVFRSRLAAFLRRHPDIRVEMSMDPALTNIVEAKFDAGVRIGEDIERDMVATRVGPDWRFSVVGSPAYFERRSAPATPYELGNHNCINLRLPTAGGYWPWEFRSPDGRDLNLRVEGQAAFNSAMPVLGAAIDGIGLGFVPQELAAPHIADGRLVEVLADWCPMIDGFYLYYPSRKRNSPAFAAFVEAMRYRSPAAVHPPV